VHALGQVASFELAAAIPAENLQRALNRTLPAAIRVLEAKRVRSGFHARHSAVTKSYEYRVCQDPICPPFLVRYVHACTWPMNLEALQEAAQRLLGEHDFLSFAATDPDLATRKGGGTEQADGEEAGGEEETWPRKGTVRRVFSSEWNRGNNARRRTGTNGVERDSGSLGGAGKSGSGADGAGSGTFSEMRGVS
jgi:tRNA pseudouridine38-40 synthase